MGVCEHLWQQKTNVCPYGVKLPFDVTWPDAARAQSHGLDENVPTNLFWILINVLYGYVPTTLMVIQLVRLIVVRGSRELCIFSVLVGTFVLNELILKQIFREARPESSCCTSCGMPSSHSAFAAALWGFHSYDLLWRLQPRRWADWDEVAESALEVFRAALRHWDALDALQCGMLFLFWSMVLLPVPCTRVVLGDHTIPQVLSGFAVGLCVSTLVWLAARILLKNHNHQLDREQSCGDWRLISHNMALPLPSLFRRMQHQELHPQEIQWYIARVTDELKRLNSAAPRPMTQKRFEEIQKTLQELPGSSGRNEDFNHFSVTSSSSHELSSFRSLQVMTSNVNRSDLEGASRGRGLSWPSPSVQRISAKEALGIRGISASAPGLAPLPSEATSESAQCEAPAAWKSFSSTNNVDGVAHCEPEVADAGSDSSFKSMTEESRSPVRLTTFGDVDTFWEDLRNFLKGKDEKRFVLRDRHGQSILIDALKYDTSVSGERFPLAVLKVNNTDGTDGEET